MNMTVKCLDCGFIDKTTRIITRTQNSIFTASVYGTTVCRKCASHNIVNYDSDEEKEQAQKERVIEN